MLYYLFGGRADVFRAYYCTYEDPNLVRFPTETTYYVFFNDPHGVCDI